MSKKKSITERKWDREFDRLSEGLCEKSNEDGSMAFSPENFDAYMKRCHKHAGLSDHRRAVQIKALIRPHQRKAS